MKFREFAKYYGEKARELLANVWDEIRNLPENRIRAESYVDWKVEEEIRNVVRGRAKSFKYAILTQILAKVVEPEVNCLCLQEKAKVDGAFDARTFCKEVVLKFEREKGVFVLGGSPDPYVSKPLRHEFISLDLRDIKYVEEWRSLYSVLRKVQDSNDPEFTKNVLKQILLEIYRQQLETDKAVPQLPATGVSMHKLENILKSFLSEPSGGVRPQAVVYALMKVLNERLQVFSDISTAKATVANSFAGRKADIECKDVDGSLKLAISVTDTLTEAKLDEELSKAVERGVKRLLIIAYDIRTDKDIPSRYKRKIDVTIMPLVEFVGFMTTMLNDQLRIEFLAKVHEVLEDFGYYDHLKAWNEVLRNNLSVG